MLFDLIVWMAIYDEQVDVAIVIVIEEFQSPPAHQPGDATDAHRPGDIVESQVVVVFVYGIHFMIHVRDEEVLPAILIEVRGIDAHPRARPPLLAEGHAGIQADVHEFSVFLVEKQEILDGVVGDEKVHPTVVVDVSCYNSPSFAQGLGDSGFLGNVLERAIAVVVEKPTAHARIDRWYAVRALVGLYVLAVFVFGFARVAEAADEEIQFAVVVVVEPDGARGPAGSRYAGLFCYIRKGAVAVVSVQNAALILGHVQIGKAIAVEIAYSDTYSIAAAGYPSLFRYISERAIAVVRVESVAKRRLWSVEGTGVVIDHVDVHPAIVVVIQKRAARSGSFRQVVVLGPAVYVLPGDTAFRGRNFFK